MTKTQDLRPRRDIPFSSRAKESPSLSGVAHLPLCKGAGMLTGGVPFIQSVDRSMNSRTGNWFHVHAGKPLKNLCSLVLNLSEEEALLYGTHSMRRGGPPSSKGVAPEATERSY